MLEKVVSEVVSKLLGDYVEGIEDEDMQFSLRQGRVRLQNLRLAPQLFHQFGLPLDIAEGVIKELEIAIPWGNLLSQPLQFRVDGIFLLAKPHPHQSGVRGTPFRFPLGSLF